ncbi:hypothetical protein V7112_16225 [Bacillus sp. JJ1566]|uniref:hypothetical protein n=1 Tax=Bacillus sp. JJ1566 TaxID=3122961 RepID=UPI0030000C13
MKKTLCITFVFLLFTSSIAGALSWAYAFVVHDGKVYEVNEDLPLQQNELGNVIGKVKTKPDEQSGDYYGNASNYYEIGTRYYEIEGISINEAIAVETEEDHYVKAVHVHDALFSFKNIFMSFNFWVIVGIVLIVSVWVTVLRSKQR